MLEKRGFIDVFGVAVDFGLLNVMRSTFAITEFFC